MDIITAKQILSPQNGIIPVKHWQTAIKAAWRQRIYLTAKAPKFHNFKRQNHVVWLKSNASYCITCIFYSHDIHAQPYVFRS